MGVETHNSFGGLENDFVFRDLSHLTILAHADVSRIDASACHYRAGGKLILARLHDDRLVELSGPAVERQEGQLVTIHGVSADDFSRVWLGCSGDAYLDIDLRRCHAPNFAKSRLIVNIIFQQTDWKFGWRL